VEVQFKQGNINSYYFFAIGFLLYNVKLGLIGLNIFVFYGCYDCFNLAYYDLKTLNSFKKDR